MAIERFDYAFSNPPYQDSSNSAIFHHFQNFSDLVSSKSSLIYPADKWMTKTGKGAGFDDFANKQLSSNHLTKITVYENANNIFNNIELHGGISIVNKNIKLNNINKIIIESYEIDDYFSTIEIDNSFLSTLSTSNRMNLLVKKVMKEHERNKSGDNNKLEFLSDSLLNSAYFGINSHYIERSTTCIKNEGYKDEKDYIKILTNSSSGKGGRVGWFWIPESEIKKNRDSIDKHILAISPRHAAGYGGRSQHAYIYGPGVIFGDCRFGVAIFDNFEEADNFIKWMGTDIIRTLIYSSSRRVKNFGVNVPLLKDYSNNSEEVDFSKTREELNQQLIKKYSFDNNDLIFMDKVIESLGSFEMPTSIK